MLKTSHGGKDDLGSDSSPARISAGRAKPRRPSLPPRGRKEILNAVLDAATHLFAKYGPASVSVRDIARVARINHALVHRHFGSKRAVLDAVVERTVQRLAGIASKITDAQSGAQRLFEAGLENAFYTRILARAMLDNPALPQVLQHGFPIISRMIELLEGKREKSDTSELRLRVGAASALTMGWLLFEPFLLRATELEHRERAEVRNSLVRLIETILKDERTEDSLS
jgi:TetR/AcrR family transcriptional regulator, repressor for neighboring sulfatase